MLHFRLLSVLLALVLGPFWPDGVRAAPESITLRVALYPYVPGAHAVFALLAREFQRKNEGVTLELIEVDPAKDYYDDGLLTLDADVYEIDSILLSDMVAAKKIAPLNVTLTDFAPEAADAVIRNGVVYAIPHWLCGNFLFYRKDDAGVRDAATWADLVRELKQRNKPLLVDFFGRLTLGEWYITLLADRVGVAAAQSAVLSSSEPDADVISDMRLILSACPTGFCRSKDLHDRTGFYARAFIRGEAHAYIGYSESLHYGLQEATNNCRAGSACVPTGDIAVRRLPPLKAGQASEGIGWVDGLAISSSLTEPKRDIALKFLAFATSTEGYEAVLQPNWMEAPRYLLPARVGLQFTDAPLYPVFFAAHTGRKTGTLPGLNTHLRTLSGKLNCALPIDRTDAKSLSGCKLP